jgi:hypothetical protein
LKDLQICIIPVFNRRGKNLMCSGDGNVEKCDRAAVSRIWYRLAFMA